MGGSFESGPVVVVTGHEVDFSMVVIGFFQLNPRPTFCDLRNFSVKLSIVDVSGCSDEYIRGTFIEFIEDVVERRAWWGILDEVGYDSNLGFRVGFKKG